MSLDLSHLVDILQAAERVQHYSQGVTLEDFSLDEPRYSTVIYQLIIIGEATKRLSSGFREQYSAIPWKQIAGMRDILVHDYNDVDLKLVWETATQAIPELIEQVKLLLPPDQAEDTTSE